MPCHSQMKDLPIRSRAVVCCNVNLLFYFYCPKTEGNVPRAVDIPPFCVCVCVWGGGRIADLIT